MGLENFLAGWESTAAPALYHDRQQRELAAQQQQELEALAQHAPAMLEPLYRNTSDPAQVDFLDTIKNMLSSRDPAVVKQAIDNIGNYQNNSFDIIKPPASRKELEYYSKITGSRPEDNAQLYRDMLVKPPVQVNMGDKPLNPSDASHIVDANNNPLPVYPGETPDEIAKRGGRYGVPKKPLDDIPATHSMVYMKNQEHIQALENALNLIDKHPDAIGPTNMIGEVPIVGQSLLPLRDKWAGNVTNPKTQQEYDSVRAAIGGLGSTARHDLSGATVTQNEKGDLLWSIESVNDRPENLKAKILNELQRTKGVNDQIEQMYSGKNYKPLKPVDAPQSNNAIEDAIKLEGLTDQEAAFARSIYQQESSSGKNTATSNAGAVGGMQILPGTFIQVADKGWDINNPVQNARAGARYAKQMLREANGDPKIAAAGYYGGYGGLVKARRGIAVSDPRNPNAPNTLQYGQQVSDRMQPSNSGWKIRVKG